MVYGEKQKQEIETIKERTIKVELSDADCERLAMLAAKVDLSVDELMTGLIGDLINGTYTHGSDEVDLAQKWFDRSYMYEQQSTNTFLKYLVDEFALDEVIQDYENIRTAEENIAITLEELESEDRWKDIVIMTGGERKTYTSREEWVEEEKAYIEGEQDLVASCKECINEYWEDFLGEINTQEQPTMEEEMKKVLEWAKRLDEFKGNNIYDTVIEELLEKSELTKVDTDLEM